MESRISRKERRKRGGASKGGDSPFAGRQCWKGQVPGILPATNLRTLTTAYIRDEGERYREKEIWKERMMGEKGLEKGVTSSEHGQKV